MLNQRLLCFATSNISGRRQKRRCSNNNTKRTPFGFAHVRICDRVERRRHRVFISRIEFLLLLRIRYVLFVELLHNIFVLQKKNEEACVRRKTIDGPFRWNMRWIPIFICEFCRCCLKSPKDINRLKDKIVSIINI